MHADSPKPRGKAGAACLLLVLSFLQLSLAACAAEANDTEVLVTGTGKTVETALRNALRNAVESVVGTLIDSESMIENDEIVNDRILAHSSGFIESYRQVGEPRQTGDGLVLVRIRAVVRNKAVIHALETANIYRAKVDGDSLFAEMVTKDDERAGAMGFIGKFLENFPQNVLNISTGKPEYNAGKKKIVVGVRLCINKDAYRKFIDNLSTVLTRSYGQPQKVGSVLKAETLQRRDFVHIEFLEKMLNHNFQNRNRYIFLCTGVNDSRTSSEWLLYEPGEESLHDFQRAVKYKELYVALMAADGHTVTSNQVRLFYPVHLSIFNSHSPFNVTAILPLLQDLNYSVNHANFGSVTPGTSDVVIPVEFDVSPEEARRVASITCEVITVKSPIGFKEN